MPVNRWTYQVDVKYFFHNNDLTFEESRDGIVTTIRNSRWFKSYDDEHDDLPLIIEELQDTQDVDEFDAVWNVVYEVADADRCWIATF